MTYEFDNMSIFKLEVILLFAIVTFPRTDILKRPTKSTNWYFEWRILNRMENCLFSRVVHMTVTTEAHLGPIKFFFGIRYNEFLNSL